MNLPLLDEEINSYKQKMHRLDSMAEDLPKEKLSKYKAARNRFEQRLKAWQRTFGSDLAVFSSNMSDGYHELEAHVVAAKYKQS